MMKRGRPSKPTCLTCGFKAQDNRGLSAHMRNAKHALPMSKYPATMPDVSEPIDPVRVNGAAEPSPETPEYHLQCAMKALLARKAVLQKIIEQHEGIKAEYMAVTESIAKLIDLHLPALEDLAEYTGEVSSGTRGKTV